MSLRDDAFYFDSLKCEICGTREDLYSHRFRDNVRCIECINKLMRLAEEKAEKYKLELLTDEVESE